MKTLKPLFYLFILSLNISFSQNIVEDLTCEQTFQLIQKYSGDVNFIIIDLSPQKLFATGHIENALYFDVFSEQFASWVNCLDKEKVYLIYCTSGHRSKIGKEKMMNMGFKNLYHLYEGIKKWKELGYPVIKEPSEVSEVEKVLNNVFGWAIEKDFDLFYNSILNDSNFISVTPYDRVKFGFEEVRKDSAFWGSPDFKAVSHQIKDLKINFSSNGDVAWFYCLLDDINTWKGEPANWENVRWTGVLEKRNGFWKVVQQHFSWPKENN